MFSITTHTIALVVCCICASSVQSTGGDDDQPYFISTIAGTGTTDALKVDVPALEASLATVYGLVQSKNGDLYASLTVKYHVVLKFEFDKAKGTWSNVEVIAGTGTQGKGADDVVGTQSAFFGPLGLSLIEDSATGEVTAILIADSSNHRIRKWTCQHVKSPQLQELVILDFREMVAWPKMLNSIIHVMRIRTSQLAIFTSLTS